MSQEVHVKIIIYLITRIFMLFWRWYNNIVFIDHSHTVTDYFILFQNSIYFLLLFYSI